MKNTLRLPYALCAYSLPHSLGFLPTRAGDPNPGPHSLHMLVDAAESHGLSGVEFPLAALVPSFDGKFVTTAGADAELLDRVHAQRLRLIADYGSILDQDAGQVQAFLRTAAAAGAKTVRATLSHLLCGDRRSLPAGWPSYFEALVQRLKEVLPIAEELGVVLAVENHQDVTSADLLDLFTESGSSPAFGITLDTGNPLAVAEDPVEFATRIGALIRHVHLKDYTVHRASNGYSLVRCAVGDGVIDFPAILRIVLGNGYPVLPSIEIAAQATRTIPIVESTWWEHHRPEQARHLVAALRTVWNHPPMERLASSAWERGEPSEAVVREEWDLVERSIDYCTRLSAT